MKNDFNSELYFERKAFWEEFFALAVPRDNSEEENDAIVNALEDRLEELN